MCSLGHSTDSMCLPCCSDPCIATHCLAMQTADTRVACLCAEPGPFSFLGRSKGKSTMELMAAYSIADHPVDLLLTDAHTHHILRLREKNIIYWANLSTPEALAHLAGYLKQVRKPCNLGSNKHCRVSCVQDKCNSGCIGAPPVKGCHVTSMNNGTSTMFAVPAAGLDVVSCSH